VTDKEEPPPSAPAPDASASGQWARRPDSKTRAATHGRLERMLEDRGRALRADSSGTSETSTAMHFAITFAPAGVHRSPRTVTDRGNAAYEPIALDANALPPSVSTKP
jgi:hypothetical protein